MLDLKTVSGYSECSCGAVTIYLKDGGQFSCQKDRMKKYLGKSYEDLLIDSAWDGIKITEYKETYMCDHCVNHYGVDLCGCGSGEEVGECEGEFDECICEIPMQTVLGDSHRGNGAWI